MTALYIKTLGLVQSHLFCKYRPTPLITIPDFPSIQLEVLVLSPTGTIATSIIQWQLLGRDPSSLQRQWNEKTTHHLWKFIFTVYGADSQPFFSSLSHGQCLYCKRENPQGCKASVVGLSHMAAISLCFSDPQCPNGHLGIIDRQAQFREALRLLSMVSGAETELETSVFIYFIT